MSEQGLQAIKQRTDNYAYGIRNIHITERYASRAIEDVWKLVAEVERLREVLEEIENSSAGDFDSIRQIAQQALEGDTK
ncbi:MAG: hypothetical protein ABS944_17795 [Solibacillus sp.]|uniref:hypothetical protein n=1 Tax=Solibacillus sp. TaxID=1909654 RepID=UPI0033153D4B